MKSKRAQSEIITTVLIILLVLAAIVIVWQVIQSTVSQGAGRIDQSAACFGINMEVQRINTSNFDFSIKRTGGDDVPKADVIVIVDGNRLTDGYSLTNNETFNLSLQSGRLHLMTGATRDVEAAIKLGDNTCPTTGRLKI